MSLIYSNGCLWMPQSQPSVWTTLPLLLRCSDTTVSGLTMKCWYKQQTKEVVKGKLR